MAIVSLNTIKTWFQTGKKPTQNQFSDTWDSFWHKLEGIPMTAITGLSDLFNQKADKVSLNTHKADAEAHPEVVRRAKIYQAGSLQVFKKASNVDLDVIEPGDVVVGIVENAFIKAVFTDGDPVLLESFNIIEQIDL